MQPKQMAPKRVSDRISNLPFDTVAHHTICPWYWRAQLQNLRCLLPDSSSSSRVCHSRHSGSTTQSVYGVGEVSVVRLVEVISSLPFDTVAAPHNLPWYWRAQLQNLRVEVISTLPFDTVAAPHNLSTVLESAVAEPAVCCPTRRGHLEFTI